MKRRTLLTGAGALAVIAATGTGFVLTREPTQALAAWSAAGQNRDDRRLHALSWAILAPNPHNRQPWIATLEGTDTIILTCDPDRRLPHTDPFDRQIVIGLGCFLELLRMAAASNGHLAEVVPFPAGEPWPRLDTQPVAAIKLVRNAEAKPDPLFAAARQRRSNKEPFDSARAVAQSDLDKIAETTQAAFTLGSTSDTNKVSALRELTWDAFETEMRTPHTLKESVDLIRIGKAEIEANPDGIDLGGPMMEILSAAGLMSREAALDPQSQAFGETMTHMQEVMRTGMAYAWIISAANTRRDQLEAGRDWIRFNLAATLAGVSVHPVSQALQEYPEMKPHFEKVREMLGVKSGETLQMLARLGYGADVPPAPRWKLESKLRQA
ncbi:MAG: twin-arginine translocation pathway signal protein [Rhizobiales bacterium]|nr:twin-arginine translocation pathway signal protein [Hyphomicrobiales bacterium]